jgi:hypothetical protein
MPRRISGENELAIFRQFVSSIVEANIGFRQESDETISNLQAGRDVAGVVLASATPTVKRVSVRMHSAHEICAGEHRYLLRANRPD